MVFELFSDDGMWSLGSIFPGGHSRLESFKHCQEWNHGQMCHLLISQRWDQKMLGFLWIAPLFFAVILSFPFLGGVVPVVNGHSTAIRLDDYLSIIYGVCLVFGCRDVFAVLLDIVWGLRKPWFTLSGNIIISVLLIDLSYIFITFLIHLYSVWAGCKRWSSRF